MENQMPNNDNDEKPNNSSPSDEAPTMKVPQRTPEGRFPKGRSGNPSGRPRGALSYFTNELKATFREHFDTPMPDGTSKGMDAMERVWRDRPDAYLAQAIRLIPTEVRVDEGRAVDDLNDEELIAIVLASRKRSDAEDED